MPPEDPKVRLQRTVIKQPSVTVPGESQGPPQKAATGSFIGMLPAGPSAPPLKMVIVLLIGMLPVGPLAPLLKMATVPLTGMQAEEEKAVLRNPAAELFTEMLPDVMREVHPQPEMVLFIVTVSTGHSGKNNYLIYRSRRALITTHRELAHMAAAPAAGGRSHPVNG